MKPILPLALIAGAIALPAHAENRIDRIRSDAPELAAYGEYTVGVREIRLDHENQIDIVNVTDDMKSPEEMPRYDRPLPVQVWYPAASDAEGSQIVKAYMRDGETVVELHGQGIVDAEPLDSGESFPLVIVSHGYPGNRFLMSPIAENLASKGYVVAAIDHTDSTYSTKKPIQSSVVNRSDDQLFVLDRIAAMGEEDGFLSGLVDADNAAIIGYSMGGYGAVISAGGGVNTAAVATTDGFFSAPPGTLERYRAGSEVYKNRFDPRLKTIIAFAPAGSKVGFFDESTLADVRVPALYIAGSRDDTVGYTDGVRETWRQSVNVERALLTFENANHNVGAPMPPPEEAWGYDENLGFDPAMHYLDFVWDNVRMNNISQHFITAWLGVQLKGDENMSRYLDLVAHSNDGVAGTSDDGAATEGTYWAGFPARSAQGLRFEVLSAAK
ncbi:dienelactone hydrolase [Rhodobacteraceae bacterium]|nr:dienelactone hydrolase [Paracoccaceae bacterium]